MGGEAKADIVERLREQPTMSVFANIGDMVGRLNHEREEAADEIERLREALKRLAELDEFVCGKPQTIEEVMNYTQFVARAALGGKQ